jgi:site-specific DNA-cytosine methylase
MENVRGWIKSKYFKKILKWLDDRNYHYWYDVIDFADYGVPQHRLRAILLASKYHPFPIPSKSSRRITWYEAIADLIPTLDTGSLAEWQKRAFRKYFSERRNKPFHFVNEQNENGSPITDNDHSAHTITTKRRMKLIQNCYFLNNSSKSTFRKSNRQAQTLTSSNPCYKVVYLQNEEDVETLLQTALVYRCSPQVGLKLQTFTDNYIFPTCKDGSINQSLSWKVIGNSVPPHGISTFLRSLFRSSHIKQGKQLALF